MGADEQIQLLRLQQQQPDVHGKVLQHLQDLGIEGHELQQHEQEQEQEQEQGQEQDQERETLKRRGTEFFSFSRKIKGSKEIRRDREREKDADREQERQTTERRRSKTQSQKTEDLDQFRESTQRELDLLKKGLSLIYF